MHDPEKSEQIDYKEVGDITQSAFHECLEDFQDADSQASYVFDEVAEKALIRKQDLRIVPLSAAIYLLCYLDRSNIGE